MAADSSTSLRRGPCIDEPQHERVPGARRCVRGGLASAATKAPERRGKAPPCRYTEWHVVAPRHHRSTKCWVVWSLRGFPWCNWMLHWHGHRHAVRAADSSRLLKVDAL